MATVNQATAVATNQSQTTAPVADAVAFGALPPVQRGIVLAQTERSMGAEAASRLANGATVPDGLIGAIARDDDVQAAVTLAGIHPERVGELKDALVAAGAKDAYHAVSTGVTDRNAIDDAQAKVADGGCAALGDEHLLCNPEGPEIGEYTLPRQEGFPDYIGPNAPHPHLYRAEAATIGGFASLGEAVADRLAANPTPGDGWSAGMMSLPKNQNRATPSGAVNDAGLPDKIVRNIPTAAEGDDQVRSYTAQDVNGNAVVSNVTIPGQHALHPGIVSQGVSQDAASTTITVVGEGNGRLSTYTNGPAEATFQRKIEGDIRAAILNDARN